MDQGLSNALHAAQQYLGSGNPRAALRELKKHSGCKRSPVGQLMLAQAYAETGEMDEAVVAAKKATKLAPSMAEAYYTLGLYLRQTRRYEASLGAYDRALALKPSLFQAQHNRGLVLVDLERFEEALSVFDQIVLNFPRLADAHHNRGILLQRLGRPGAIEAFQAAIREKGTHQQAHLHLARALEAIGDSNALVHYQRAASIDQRDVKAKEAEALLLFKMEKFQAALESIDRLRSLGDDGTELLTLKGRCLSRLKRHQEALETFDRLLRTTPDDAHLTFAKATELASLERFDEALALIDASASVSPEMLALKAVIFRDLQRTDEGVLIASEGLKQFPDNAYLRYIHSELLLARGDFEEGWKHFEGRLATPGGTSQGRGDPHSGSLPLLADLAGKRIVVDSEQGFGDTLQFCRYLPLLAQHCAGIDFRCGSGLHRVLRSLETPQLRLADPGFAVPAQAPVVRLMSLPGILWPVVSSIPANVPYLSAEPERIAKWAQRIGPEGFRMGINWQGSPSYLGDAWRSPPLTMFEGLSRVPNARVISLQAQNGLDQLNALPEGFTVERLEDFDSDPEHRFIDAAAVITCLDLVVTSDSAIAHLAGALGKPVFLAVSLVPDWRWMDHGITTPWYPTMRLFRQTERGGWQKVFAAIQEAVIAMQQAGRGKGGAYDPFFDRLQDQE